MFTLHLKSRAKFEYLVDSEIGIGRDDGAAAEVDALAAQVATETALFALEALREAARELLGLHVERNAAELRVDVESALELQEIPVVHDHAEQSVLSRVTLDGVVQEDNLGQLDGHVVLGP